MCGSLRSTTTHFEREEVCQALQPELTPVDVVTEEEELSRGEVHAKLPDVVREEVQVLIYFFRGGGQPPIRPVEAVTRATIGVAIVDQKYVTGTDGNP